MGLISLNSAWGFMVSLCKTTEAYAASERGILLSSIPILHHTCTTSCCQVSISSTQFLDPAHNPSYKKNDPLSHGSTIASDTLSSFVISGGGKGERGNAVTHSLLSGNTVSNCETTLYFRTNLSWTIYMLQQHRDISTFGSLMLCWIWLFFFHSNW